MGTNLKRCLAFLAVVVATAAHAEGEGTYRSAEASSGQSVRQVAPHRHAADANREAAGAHEHAMSPSDQHAGTGGGSAEPQMDRGPSEKKVEAAWNRQEFLRNTWSTP